MSTNMIFFFVFEIITHILFFLPQRLLWSIGDQTKLLALMSCELIRSSWKTKFYFQSTRANANGLKVSSNRSFHRKESRRHQFYLSTIKAWLMLIKVYHSYLTYFKNTIGWSVCVGFILYLILNSSIDMLITCLTNFNSYGISVWSKPLIFGTFFLL